MPVLRKAVYCHPVYLTYMQSTSWEMLHWKKYKLELRLSGETSITSDMQITPFFFWGGSKVEVCLQLLLFSSKLLVYLYLLIFINFILCIFLEKNPFHLHFLIHFHCIIISVQLSHWVMSDSWQPHGLQHARRPCPSPIFRACSNSHPSSQWCHPFLGRKWRGTKEPLDESERREWKSWFRINIQ